MGKVMGYCKEITRLTGAMVSPVHHSGKDESRGARGWSGLRAACDFEFEVLRAGVDRLAVVTKMKGGADGGEFGFRLETLIVGQDDDGDDETTCVVQFTDGSRQAMTVAAGPKGDIGKDLLAKAAALLDFGNGVLTRNELVNAVVATRPMESDGRDQRKTSVSKALNSLIKSGLLLQSAAGMITLPNKPSVQNNANT